MKILIIGGLGFIGSNIAKFLLNKNIEVSIIDNLDLKNLNKCKYQNVNYIKHNLLNYFPLDKLSQDYTHIIHLAALLGVADVIKAPFKVLDENIKLTLNAIQIAKHQTNLKQFMFASTSEIYMGTLESNLLNFPTPEKTKIILPDLHKPRTSYMLSKLYGEALCMQSGLPTTIIRPHNIYGPNMGYRHVIPQLIEKALNKENNVLEVYSPDHSRTFCFISDAVNMIYNLMTNERSIGEVFNIGNETPEIKIKDLANLIIRVVGKDIKIKEMKNTEGSPYRRVPCIKKLRKIINLKPKIDLEQGIKKCYNNFKST